MTVFLPCRAGSQRIPDKNTRTFAGVEGGLLAIKLSSLLKTMGIDKIVLSTNDPKVLAIAASFEDEKLIIDHRPDHLASSSTSTDDLVNYVPGIISDEHILWTHVTSPFISTETFEKAIAKYNQMSSDYDSLMSVNKVQTFLWNEDGPINYDRNVEKWPRTQTLPVLYEVNSGFFINSRTSYLEHKDRIGRKPMLFETKGIETIDIDWPEDFDQAELIYQHHLRTLK